MSKFQNHYSNNDDAAAEVKVKKDKTVNKKKRKDTKNRLSRLTIDDMYNEDIDYDFDE